MNQKKYTKKLWKTPKSSGKLHLPENFEVSTCKENVNNNKRNRKQNVI